MVNIIPVFESLGTSASNVPIVAVTDDEDGNDTWVWSNDKMMIGRRKPMNVEKPTPVPVYPP